MSVSDHDICHSVSECDEANVWAAREEANLWATREADANVWYVPRHLTIVYCSY